MTRFIIRIQRKTILPGGVETDLRAPFAHRVWEIHERPDPDGPAEYYGFGWSAEDAWDTVKKILRTRARRHALTPRGVAALMGLDSDALTDLPHQPPCRNYSVRSTPIVLCVPTLEPQEQPC